MFSQTSSSNKMERVLTTNMKSLKEPIDEDKRIIMNDSQFQLENLKKKLIRLMERQKNWKPFKFDFENDKVSFNSELINV